MESGQTTNDLRLRRLEERVRRLEAKLKLHEIADPADLMEDVESHADPIAPATPQFAEVAAPVPTIHRPPALPVSKPAGAEPATLAMETLQARLDYVRLASAEQRKVPTKNLEQMLGLKWAGWIGAVVLLVGGALGVKFAYDNGWFGGVPASVRVALIALAGFGLNALGEAVLRRVHRVPAASLFGAGVATLFIAAYAGNAYYHLYDSTIAQIAMAAAMLIGTAIAMRADLAAIGILALVGGNIAPLVIGKHDAPLGSFLLYIGLLQITALFMSALGRGGKWWSLRGMSLATTCIWIAYSLQHQHARDTLVLSAMLISAALYHAELLLTTSRQRHSATPSVVGQAFVLFAASALAAGVLINFDSASSMFRSGIIVAMAIVHAGVGILFAQPRFTILAPLSIAHRLVAVGLITLAIPIALKGDSVSLSWTVLALCLAILHLRTASAASRIAAPIVWALAIVDLLWLNAQLETHRFGREFVASAIGLDMRPHALAAMCASVSGYIVARCIGWPRRGKHFPEAAKAIAFIATILTTIAANAFFHPAVSISVLLAVGWLLLIARPLLRPLQTTWYAIALFVMAALAISFDDLRHLAAIDDGVLSISLALGLLIAGSIAGVFFMRGDDLRAANRDAALLPILTAVAITLAWTFSFEWFRVVSSFGFDGVEAFHLRSAGASVVWVGVAAAAIFAYGRLSEHRIAPPPLWLNAISISLALKYLLMDALAWRVVHSPLAAKIAITIELASACAVIATLLFSALARHRQHPKQYPSPLHSKLAILAAVVFLMAGSLEIDRAFLGIPALVSLADPHLATLVGLSIFWGAAAIASIVAGFARRVALLRYFGLSLLGITLLKIVLLDMQQAARGYRVISFLAVGGVLILTSIVYGKISPRFADAEAPDAAPIVPADARA